MAISDQTIEEFLSRYGRWRNRDLRGGRGGSMMHTPTTRDATGSYWQPCQQCYGTGADLQKAGSGVKSRSALHELAKTHTCLSCRGRGGHRETVPLADPAAIPATGPGGMHIMVDDTPQEYLDLEAALVGMDEANQGRGYGPRHRAVIEARYVHFPRARARQGVEQFGEKARVEWVNERIRPDRISGKMFAYLLVTTKRRLSDIFGAPLKRDRENEERRMTG